eukprot:TRINITY_DN62218_c0_g1_i1.p3 TRINITY_DN62218_c0_g1~~TRINITY_DN62218_c0_g1_i1.p3  ORF type:complete len:162 (+),score=46.46 TRINITY_DN62218_c0_g1_i1:72-488(+)
MPFPVLVYTGAAAGGALSGGCGAVIANWFMLTCGKKKEDPGLPTTCARGCVAGAVTGVVCAGLADLDPALNFIDKNASSWAWHEQMSVGARIEGSCGCPMGMATACLLADDKRRDGEDEGDKEKEAAPVPGSPEQAGE